MTIATNPAPDLTALSIPDHVPPHLVRDFDYISSGDVTDINAFWAQLRDGPEIFYTPRQGGHWVLTRFEDIAHVLATHEDFSSIYEVIPKGSTRPNVPPIGMDPPQHTEFRRLLQPFFSPKSIENLEGRSRQLTLDLLEKFSGATACEFVSDFSLTMPIGIFMSLVALPDNDRLYLLDAAERAVRSSTAEGRMEAYQELEVYLGKVLEQRREDLGDDMLSALLKARVEGGRPLTQRELIDAGSLLLVGGLDTVAGMLGFIMMFLAKNDKHRRRLVEEPELIPQAIEEMMRLYSSANIARIVIRDMEYKGISMKAGDAILAAMSMSGIDERQYDNPLVVDFDRPDKRSLVFGKGPHQCIGSFLARTELRVFLTEWLRRVPDFRIKPGDEPRVASGPANTVLYLPLVWDVPLA